MAIGGAVRAAVRLEPVTWGTPSGMRTTALVRLWWMSGVRHNVQGGRRATEGASPKKGDGGVIWQDIAWGVGRTSLPLPPN